MLYLKFLHILTMFVAVTLFVGTSLYLTLLARRGDRKAFVNFGRLIRPVNGAAILFILLGLAFGLATALTGNLDLTATWLIIAYVIFGVMFAIGGYEGATWSRLSQATDASLAAGGEGTGAVIDSSRAQMLGLVSVAGYVAIIFDMVVKPFS